MRGDYVFGILLVIFLFSLVAYDMFYDTEEDIDFQQISDIEPTIENKEQKIEPIQNNVASASCKAGCIFYGNFSQNWTYLSKCYNLCEGGRR